MSKQQKGPHLPEVPLWWQSTLYSARQGWTNKPLAISIGPARMPSDYQSQAAATRYPPRLVVWIIFLLDQARRVDAADPHAVEVKLFAKGQQPYVLGYFDGRSKAFAGLLRGLNDYYRRVYKQAQRDLRLARHGAGMVYISAQICGTAVTAARFGKNWRERSSL